MSDIINAFNKWQESEIDRMRKESKKHKELIQFESTLAEREKIVKSYMMKSFNKNKKIYIKNITKRLITLNL